MTATTTTKAYFKSQKDNWETPDNLFAELHKEFDFEVDAAADRVNAKCPMYFNESMNGLTIQWHNTPYNTFWVNPPYSKNKFWVAKAAEEAKHGCRVVMLLPARTDVKWFHEFIYQKPKVEIRFLKGRLKFVGAEHSAPFPSMVVVFHPQKMVKP